MGCVCLGELCGRRVSCVWQADRVRGFHRRPRGTEPAQRQHHKHLRAVPSSNPLSLRGDFAASLITLVATPTRTRHLRGPPKALPARGHAGAAAQTKARLRCSTATSGVSRGCVVLMHCSIPGLCPTPPDGGRIDPAGPGGTRHSRRWCRCRAI